jgi:UDP-N-acetylmuramoyl-L-alanyl-D-glutamate--2,6-diaminopimelate ligase
VTTYPEGGAEPGASELAEMLVAMVERGCAGGIIEISLEALARRSVEGIAFDAAVLTDIRLPEDLDDLVNVRRAYARLFRRVTRDGVTVLNGDDRDADLFGAVNLETRRVAFSIGGRADVTARIEHQDTERTRFRLRGFDRETTVDLRVAGRSTVSQAVAAATVALSRGLPAEDVVAGLEAVTQIPGRLEAVREGQPYEVWVDGARTERELDDVLSFLRTHCAGRIHCLLSADVEPSHASALAKVAETKADRVVVSIDNTHVDNPDSLLDEMLTSFQRPGRVRVEPNRRKAIEDLLELAVPGDAVLITGGSGRTIAILDKRPVRCDDRAIATAWIRRQQVVPRRRSA